MMRIKTTRVLLISLLALLMLVPAAFATDQVALVFNGQEYQADVYVENGVSYISQASLAKIPILMAEGEGYVPLREFFTARGGIVEWEAAANRIVVNWRNKQGDWYADELVIESGRIMQELNTYKMKGRFLMEMAMPDTEENPQIPHLTTELEGVFQQDPLAIHMKQAVKLPVEEMEMTKEDEALLKEGSFTTEMVWKDNVIYQKLPTYDQWIAQDLNMMENMTNLLQTSPQQSLEMMREYGVINVFGDNVMINGQEYYTVKTFVDSATYRRVLEGVMSDDNLAQALTGPEIPAAGEDDMADAMLVLEQLLDSMELNYYVDTFINTETLLQEHMAFAMELKYALDQTSLPAGSLDFALKMSGNAELYDFGAGIELPDVSNAVTQEEYLEQLLNTSTVPGAV